MAATSFYTFSIFAWFSMELGEENGGLHEEARNGFTICVGGLPKSLYPTNLEPAWRFRQSKGTGKSDCSCDVIMAR